MARLGGVELADEAGGAPGRPPGGALDGKELGAEGDRRSHQLLMARLAERFPEDRVRSEEADQSEVLGSAVRQGVDHRPAGRDPRVLGGPGGLGGPRGPGRRR